MPDLEINQLTSRLQILPSNALERQKVLFGVDNMNITLSQQITLDLIWQQMPQLYIVERGNATQGTLPTPEEVAAPVERDTCNVKLTNRIIEWYKYESGVWVLKRTDIPSGVEPLQETNEAGNTTSLDMEYINSGVGDIYIAQGGQRFRESVNNIGEAVRNEL